MKKSVGLVVMTMIPQEDGSKVLMVVLQRRGYWNTEKMKPESYPGCCQVSVHGGLKDGEDRITGLIRESQEELGEAFTQSCKKQDLSFLQKMEDSGKEVATYGLMVPFESLREIRLGPDSGGIDLIPESMTNGEISVLVEIKPEYKISGPPAGVRAMFPDEIEAVRKAFELFKQ